MTPTKRIVILMTGASVMIIGAIALVQRQDGNLPLLWKVDSMQTSDQANNGASKKLRPAIARFNDGDYAKAEALAAEVVRQKGASTVLTDRTEVARARYIMAFAAARRKDMTLARVRFGQVASDARKLPQKTTFASDSDSPYPEPSLTEEAVYQHAVCTGTLGKKKEAIAEYMAFMKQYPASPLLNPAMNRIERLNGGDAPIEAQKVWAKADRLNRARTKAERIANASCGPECLAELLERKGRTVSKGDLVIELKTKENGTSLGDMVKAAKKRGVEAHGMRLEASRLRKQALPCIVMLNPGHYALLEEAGLWSVKLWDPNYHRTNTPGVEKISFADFQKRYLGIAIVFSKPVK